MVAAIGRGEDVYTGDTFPGGLSAYLKASGTAAYRRDGGRLGHLRAFDSPQQMWSAVYRGVEAAAAALRASGADFARLVNFDTYLRDCAHDR